MARATTSTVDAPTQAKGERFAFAIESTLAPSPPVASGAERPARRRRRRLFTDPVWVLCASVLMALDAAVLFAISDSVWIMLMVLVISAALGSYRHRHTLTLSEGDGRYVILTAAVMVPMLVLDEPPGSDVLFTILVLASLLVSRTLGFWLVKQIRRRRPRRVFIAGAGHIARVLDRVLVEHPDYGLAPAAFVSDVAMSDADRPVYSYAEAFAALGEGDALGLLCAFGPEPPAELHALVRACEEDRRRVWTVPRLFDLAPRRDHIWGVAVAVIHRPPIYNPIVRGAKRAIDLVFGVLALVLLSPVLLVIAFVVRLSSPGPVLFRQRRLGLRGREFTMLKFRTMRVTDTGDTGWTTRDDPRRTFAGRMLRRTSLDELPQLVNVVRGDMSLVGPRPERRVYAEAFAQQVPTYPERTRAAGGITGLAQVHDLRGDTSIEDRARFDNLYIDQYSLFLDVVIALKTVGSLFRSKQSY
jgi:exopolysaccharide biosynthesis polyprenyl glycosylphosphotransferase